jgi:hypothetical protein
VGNVIQRAAAILHAEERAVQVSLEGEDLQRAQNGMKLYPGDTISTAGGAHASLSFFDGTFVRLDERTDLAIVESARGKKRSALSLEIREGGIWIAVPPVSVFTGAILRTVRTELLSYTLPTRMEGILSEDAAIIFAADGAGVTVEAVRRMPIFLGEGQQLRLPVGITDLRNDLYAYRTPLDPVLFRTSFVEKSRAEKQQALAARSPTEESELPEGTVLSLTRPTNGLTVTTRTLQIAGKVGEGVVGVRVNEHPVALDESHTFFQELALPEDATEFTVRVEALDGEGVVLDEVSRVVKRELRPITPPTIGTPVKEGEIFRTQRQELVIRGTAPLGAIGILVNDYRLQLFTPGDSSWNYLASRRLENLHDGKNVYEVFAIDASGKKSEPARITILVEEGPEGIVKETEETKETKETDEAELPTNPPLTPGVLRVMGPTPGIAHTATGSEFLLEGTTSRETASVWINDYRLQLYTPGRTFWNYIASVELRTLKRGSNVYRIIARNAKGEILDALEYTVTFRPPRTRRE